MAIIMSPEDISKEACGQPREPGHPILESGWELERLYLYNPNDIVGLLVFLDLS